MSSKEELEAGKIEVYTRFKTSQTLSLWMSLKSHNLSSLMLRGRNSQFLKKRETSPNSIEVEFSLESKMIEFRIDPKAL